MVHNYNDISRRHGFISKRKYLQTAITAILLIFLFAQQASATESIRIGVLKYGTVSWELDVIKRNKLDIAEGINLEIIPYAGTQATLVALQTGTVDIVVSDWIWVSKQRSSGKPYTFIPYSSALGAIMVPAESPIRNLKDLHNKDLGVAGGALDKSWLMLKLYAKQHDAIDLATDATPKFAAPPLLNGQLEHQKIDAVLNYWHYCTRLESKGYQRLIAMQDVVASLIGFETQLPMLGYVFDENWANDNESMVQAFAAASIKARDIMRNDDNEWDKLRGIMKADDDDTFTALRRRYREGIPQSWSKLERAAAAIIMRILAKEGGSKLVGDKQELSPGTFWGKLEF